MTCECKIDTNGDKQWYNSKGKLHRKDGPAVEYADGYKAWYINGKRHRENGPAMEYANGNRFWYINDDEYTHSDWITEVRKKKLASL